MITADEFDAAFDSFRATAYRLETLPAYDVGGQEAVRLQAWREHAPRPVQSVTTSGWLARIAATTLAGKRWARTRVVDDPPTSYQRFQLAHAYPEAQAVGDEVRIVRRSVVGEVGSDFWLFDAGTPGAFAITMDYDNAGHWVGGRKVTDPIVLARLARVQARVDAAAAPLNVYLAELVDA